MPTLLPTGLASDWQPKLYTAGIGAGLLQIAEHVAHLYGRLFDADPLLVLLCVTLLFVDAATGIAAAIKRGERISSKAFRRTGWKAVEYTAVAGVMIMVSNAFAHTWAHYVTDSMGVAALLYIASAEVMSIVENVTGSRAAAVRLLRRIRGIRDDGPDGGLLIEEIVTRTPVPAPPAEPGA